MDSVKIQLLSIVSTPHNLAIKHAKVDVWVPVQKIKILQRAYSEGFMIELIIGFVILAIAVMIVVKVFKILLNLLLVAIGFFALITCGVQIALSYLFEKLGKLTRSRQIISVSIAVISVWLVISWSALELHEHYESVSFSSLKYIISALLFIAIPYKSKCFNLFKKSSMPLRTIESKESLFYVINYSAFALSLSAAYSYLIFNYFNWSISYVFYVDTSFWLVSLLCQFYIISLASDIEKISTNFQDYISKVKGQRYAIVKRSISGGITILEPDEADMLIQGMIAKSVTEGFLTEIELESESWVFQKSLYDKAYNALQMELTASERISDTDIPQIVSRHLPFYDNDATFYIENHVEFGQFYNFSDGKYFCAFEKRQSIRTCACCGITEVTLLEHNAEWICSDLCLETEEICYEIKQQPYDKFIANATTSGFIVMSGAKAWDSNQKVFAVGGQGHGFAAENANHKIDSISGKNAKILGADNAKDGADRLVDGELIQTKYCSTGRRSVNEAFKGEGSYRYLDSNGNPMQLEVPKDQYDSAIKTMENKIRDGKVPGVSDPNEAESLIRRGHLTYEQARNITKFGTVESVIYDISEGAVVGLTAAGISFGITATIYYLNTKDKSEALRAAALQAGKTFGTTMVVFVGAQQLHRLDGVQQFLKVVDVNHLPPSVKKVLGDGFGTTSTAGINKALRGSVVTSAVIIAVSSGPDLLKIVRGRMSGAQFLQNVTVASTGVVGGTIGSVAGGALCSPLGPAGMVAGRIVGGMVGGSISSFVATKIAGQLRENDREKMMKIIKVQFEFLATTFMLTPEELDSVNQNLEQVINQKTFEKMYAAKQHRNAFANMLLKPIFVGVVKQRPILTFDSEEVVSSLEKLAA